MEKKQENELPEIGVFSGWNLPNGYPEVPGPFTVKIEKLPGKGKPRWGARILPQMTVFQGFVKKDKPEARSGIGQMFSRCIEEFKEE